MPKLALFDIDGTLTRTQGLCDRHFAAAVHAVLGRAIDMDWSHDPDVTDSGITHSAFERALGRGPSAAELEEIRARYARSLDAAELSAAALPGARDVLPRLEKRGWRVAIATGNWAAVAARKLDWCGIERRGVPLATADDAQARADILRAGIGRAGPAPDGAVYVGDAEWDRAAAREAGIGFLAVGERLASPILGYEDLDALVEALEAACR